MAEKLGRAAFVGKDVRFGVAEDDAPGRRDVRQRQGVCSGPGRHQKACHIALEDLTEPALSRRGPIVIAVAPRIAATCLRQSVENGGRNLRRVVAGKIHWPTGRTALARR